MKRLAGALFFLSLLLYNGTVQAEALSAIIIEEKTGRILYESNAHQQLPMASTTKIMTALIALEHCALDEIVTAGPNAFGVPGTSIYLEEGEQLTMEQMLYGLMLSSGNDAAVAIAEHVAGSTQAFCALMNARATEIGCEGTHYATPHGLPAEDHYTTAYDLAIISKEAMQNPVFRQIVSTQRASIPWLSHGYDRILTNKNRLLESCEGAIGIKTGYTKAAGRCLSFAAERDGMTLIGAVLNCPDWFDVSAQLLDNAFSQYELKHAFYAGDVIAAVDVTDGTEKSVQVIVEQDVLAPVRKEEEPSIVISLPQSLPAGFSKGEIIGLVEMTLKGETLSSVPIVTLNGVQPRTFLTDINRNLADWLLISNEQNPRSADGPLAHAAVVPLF